MKVSRKLAIVFIVFVLLPAIFVALTGETCNESVSTGSGTATIICPAGTHQVSSQTDLVVTTWCERNAQ